MSKVEELQQKMDAIAQEIEFTKRAFAEWDLENEIKKSFSIFGAEETKELINKLYDSISKSKT